jgi:hypothetical protein
MKIKNYKCSGTVILMLQIYLTFVFSLHNVTKEWVQRMMHLHYTRFVLEIFCKIWGLIKISGAEFFIEKLLTVLKYDIWQYLILLTRGSGGRLTQVMSWSTVHVFPSVALWTEHATVCHELLRHAKNDASYSLDFTILWLFSVPITWEVPKRGKRISECDSHSKCNTRSECSKRRTPLRLNPL